MKQKNKKRGLLSMLLGTLAASLLESALTEKENKNRWRHN